MSVYVITGASRGLGFEMLRQLSEDKENTVIGLVRDKAAAERKTASELGERSNVHILHGDLDNYASLEQAAADTAAIVGGRGVDYLVANAALVSKFDAFDPIDALADNVPELEEVCSAVFRTNVVGNVHLFHLFLPLVLKGKVKKVIALTSGHADLDLINDLGIETSALYAASKAALNVVVAKYSAQYERDGVLFVSMSPGVVETGQFSGVTPEQMQKVAGFLGAVMAHAPHFRGPIPVDEAVRTIMATWEKISIEDGYGGRFISQHGNRDWF